MTRFILIAGAMLACSLLFVLPPLLRREVGSDAPVKLPRQRWPVILVGLFVPVLAASLYALLGTPAALVRPPEPALAAASPGAAVGPEQVEAMVARLAARLAKEPNDADGWRMLARSYETLRRFDQAADAYRHLLALEPATPELLVDYAVILGMTLNTSLVGEPEALIARALAIDPNHIQALALSGSAALERGDYASAVKPWKKILALVPADSDIGKSISANIAQAEAQAQRR
ncbi:tetratricopeptide repeat-containing protein [Janthinobacterium sp. HH01]|uniref:tetratricopeptide repeat protein n=1 Tax=Janthinobacterium sp. HH01 TaxID=1198452 RepID=UPI0002AE7FE0|nr:tetratricopeptide repeat protein [Janthinobacterium sp. HH01]ELX13155.1 tetratricopeptide repeat-containing protein [Janthinobacterium sp. HH01]